MSNTLTSSEPATLRPGGKLTPANVIICEPVAVSWNENGRPIEPLAVIALVMIGGAAEIGTMRVGV